MRRSHLRYSIVAVGVAGFVVAGLPAVSASPGPAVGDRCLIGTWRDNGGVTSTKWQGHTVKMHAGGNDFDHIAASGLDRDGWSSSNPLVGKVAGHPLTERIHGHNTLLLRASGHRLVLTEQGWGAKATNRYLYRGKHSMGYLNQTGSTTSHFSCSLSTLTFRGAKGNVTSTETRVSFTP